MNGTELDDERDAEYRFDALVAAEEWHFWFRERRELILWALSEYLPNAQRLLEVGCGAGFVLDGVHRRLPSVQLTACDRSFEALGHTRKRVGDVRLIQADVRHLPLHNAFDAVAAFDVIEHVRDDGGALREIFGVLRPGGRLLLTVPQHQWLWSRVDEFSHHRRRYNRTELVAKARAAGFEIIGSTSFFAATLPFALASRWAMRPDRSFDPTAELRLSKSLNRALSVVLRPEMWLIKKKISLPVGSSLLLIAKRPES